jgi:hypothetical protein
MLDFMGGWTSIYARISRCIIVAGLLVRVMVCCIEIEYLVSNSPNEGFCVKS